MRKYKIMFIVCFLIVLGFLIYTFLPQLNNMSTTYNESKEGDKLISQNDLRNTNLGERYISEDVKKHNEKMRSKEFNAVEEQDGAAPEEAIVKYATPIYGGDAVARYFENSSNYYHGEIKLEEAFYNYIPELLNTTANMPNTQLKNYFEANSDVIERRIGITDPDAFVKFIGSMDRLNGRKYTRIEVISKSITENYTNMTINFLLELTLDDGNRIAPVSVSLAHLKSTPNQTAPYVKLVGLHKSQRAE